MNGAAEIFMAIESSLYAQLDRLFWTFARGESGIIASMTGDMNERELLWRALHKSDNFSRGT